MARSFMQDDDSIVALLEFFGVIGLVFLLLLFYTQKDRIARVFRSFASLFKIRGRKGDPIGDEQTASNDLEKGSSEGQPSRERFRAARSSLHLRVLAYLCSLPRETHDFLHTREVSICGSEEHSSGDTDEGYEGSEESLESNWIEIIYGFPVPSPEAAAKKVVSEGQDIATPAAADVSDDTVICCTGDSTAPHLPPELHHPNASGEGCGQHELK